MNAGKPLAPSVEKRLGRSESSFADLTAFALQCFPEIGMRDCDHPVGTLIEWLAAQLGGAKFSDDDVGIAAGSGYHSTQPRDDPAGFAAERRRWHRDDRMAARCQVRAAQEVALAAHSSNLHA